MNRILILDFGSQFTQLLARRIRELNVYCEIHPYNQVPSGDWSGLILSGSPCSVRDTDAPNADLTPFRGQIPILGVCYGAQLLAARNSGQVNPSKTREYGRADFNINSEDSLFKEIPTSSVVWMSHGDTITSIPDNFKVIGSTDTVKIAAFCAENEPTYGIQFHPEVTHSAFGKQIISNFVLNICKCEPNWTSESFIDTTISQLKQQIREDKVILGLSGGVDSSVAAFLLHRAIGSRLTCIFVDNGLLRKNEFIQVLESYHSLGLNVIGVQAADQFYAALAGVTEPEAKRKAIGKTFIDIFDIEAKKISGVKWLGQGTIYPDVIESVNVKGPSQTIKSHHNVGGLPARMNLKVVEPIRTLFKDEVRKVGRSLGVPDAILQRHPFPGPGLGIRILGDITSEKVALLQEVDDIFISSLKEHKLYDSVWQAFAVLLPVSSVGVMGDERTYEKVVSLRAVSSVDGMTADWSRLPYEFLAEVSNRIVNRVKGVNRVVYDISSKPPATIEWE